MLRKPDTALVGDWQGTLEVGTVKLRARFSVQDPGADMRGTMTSLDQGNAKVNPSRVGDKNGTVHLEMDDMVAHFEGRWNVTNDQLKGEWYQLELQDGRAIFPLAFLPRDSRLSLLLSCACSPSLIRTIHSTRSTGRGGESDYRQSFKPETSAAFRRRDVVLAMGRVENLEHHHRKCRL